MGADQPSVQPGRVVPPPADDRNAQKLQKRQEKTLQQFGPFLQHILDPDEKILFATRACSPLTFGQYLTTGWLIFILKRCVLIFTSKRILHLPTTRGFSPRGSVATVAYGDIVQVNTGSFLGRKLILQYRTGGKETFQQFPSFEFKRLRDLLPTLQLGTGLSAIGRRGSLCPRCKGALAKREFVCRTCGLEFKNRKRAAWLSILLPGGGYFYTRHPIMGFFDAIVETYLLLFFVLMIGAALFSSGEDAAGAAAAAVFFGIILVLEKMVTVSHAFHFVDEFIPVDKNAATAGTSGFAPVR